MNSTKSLTLCLSNLQTNNKFDLKMSNLNHYVFQALYTCMYNMIDLARTPLQSHGTFKSNTSMLDEIWVVNCSAGLIGRLHLGKQVQVRPTELSKAYNAYYFGMSAQIYLVYLPTKHQ